MAHTIVSWRRLLGNLVDVPKAHLPVPWIQSLTLHPVPEKLDYSVIVCKAYSHHFVSKVEQAGYLGGNTKSQEMHIVEGWLRAAKDGKVYGEEAPEFEKWCN